PVPQAAKPPVVQYVLLAMIAAMAILYHVRLAQDILLGERVTVPFFAPDAASASVDIVSPDAEAAGIHSGDVLLAINGRPYTGTAVLAEESARATPGTALAVKVRSSNSGAATERMVHIPVTFSKGRTLSMGTDVVVGFALPIFCVLLGVWVV